MSGIPDFVADQVGEYQVMECSDPLLLEQWIARWSDLVDFEVLEIVPSAQAAKQIEPRL